jgi:hypothetical protein
MKHNEPTPRTIRVNQHGPAGLDCVPALEGEVESGLRELAHHDNAARDQRERKNLETGGTEDLRGNRHDQQGQQGEHLSTHGRERSRHQMGPQHVDRDWLHGVISWPDETHADVGWCHSPEKALTKAPTKAPAVLSVDVITIELQYSDNST